MERFSVLRRVPKLRVPTSRWLGEPWKAGKKKARDPTAAAVADGGVLAIAAAAAKYPRGRVNENHFKPGETRGLGTVGDVYVNNAQKTIHSLTILSI